MACYCDIYSLHLLWTKMTVRTKHDVLSEEKPTSGLWNQWSVDCDVVSKRPELINFHPLNTSTCSILRSDKGVKTNSLQDRQCGSVRGTNFPPRNPNT